MNKDQLAPDDVLNPVLQQIEDNPEAAVVHMNELIGRYGNDARLHFLRGSVLAGLERYAEARVAMQKAIVVAPGYDLARFQLGFLELTSGDADMALATWTPLFDLPPDNPLNLFVRGLNRMLEDAFPEAIALLEEGISLNQVLPPMNRDMGLLVTEMRQKLAAQPTEPEIESDAHFLLKQFTFKNTKH